MTIEKNENQLFSTSQVNLAAFLIALGGKVVDVDVDQANPKFKIFLFQLTDEIQAEIPHYYDGTKKVSALVLMNSRQTAYQLLRDDRPKNS